MALMNLPSKRGWAVTDALKSPTGREPGGWSGTVCLVGDPCDGSFVLSLGSVSVMDPGG